MTSMIIARRSFETNTKIIRTAGDMLDTLPD
ncbi:flagellar basal body rod C-terminal domain-containing protein [Candidatus Desulfovibrio trichonymphae]